MITLEDKIRFAIHCLNEGDKWSLMQADQCLEECLEILEVNQPVAWVCSDDLDELGEKEVVIYDRRNGEMDIPLYIKPQEIDE